MANMIAILTDVILPFYKYVMEMFDLNIFSGIGLIMILFSVLIQKIENISHDQSGVDHVEQSITRKKSSQFRRKQSDVIIDQMIKKSSMISQQIGYFVLDKEDALDDKKNPYSSHSLLEINNRAKLLENLQN
ncbi:hypothetical protein IMG5_113430 [Ichthyophthirius multifiliis]|uniref:Uncharacterized protein n=1 Tax=Ichthyophthirius multifiliis TaxID=5932 RepID=G0QU02_ICHMU|nr:hypothetical protein IMG5_113430 [Ichthyophthirius multifiliis]EGR31306.1 hypothetical protein IMG5_113430 [Ichthyophthirius multifiliis]|eukprot:XP_004034792.1 hypothetical protein IMG5_113430 [Ichthyophthirius multifiliis]